MVAYSFKRRFVEPIRAGTKCQTIRGERRRHARPGEPVQLYCGMRTKGCFRIIGDPLCESVTPIRIEVWRRPGPSLWMTCELEGRDLTTDEIDHFARIDGFDDGLDMAGFWLADHGAGREEVDFSGVLIRWRSATLPREPEADRNADFRWARRRRLLPGCLR